MGLTDHSYGRRRVLRTVGAVGGAGVAGCLGSGDDQQGSLEQLPCHGDPEHLDAVQQHPSQGAEHVDPGTEIDYAQYPPTSGTHYPTTVEAGFYDEPQPLGAVVHSLEHGAVVVYYGSDALSEAAEDALREHATTYTGSWASVIAMPDERDEPASPYTVTAWQHSLGMDSYDDAVVRSFIAEYLGRGPENDVRDCD